MEPGRTPTEAHTGLKNLIDALVEEIREDTAFQVNTLLYKSFHTNLFSVTSKIKNISRFYSEIKEIGTSQTFRVCQFKDTYFTEKFPEYCHEDDHFISYRGFGEKYCKTVYCSIFSFLPFMFRMCEKCENALTFTQ